MTMGVQHPRIWSVPEYVSSAGQEVIELAALAGLHLDPWQQFVLTHSLGERPDGRWAAFEVGLAVPRQNGKGGILEARELGGLFVLGERMLIHSAHEFATSLEAFRRLLMLIEDTPELERRVQRVSRSHGEEGIELKGGQRIRFRTRTKGGGRGFSGDLVILDEAMILPEASHGALLPVVSARPNPQVWYTGSAVDQNVHEDGVVFARVRERGVQGGDPSLAYFEWSAEFASPDEVAARDACDERLHAVANPALGIRITGEHIANEQRSMDPRTFAVERLNVGDWPATERGAGSVISSDAWEALADPDDSGEIVGGVAFAIDTSPDRSYTSIGVASVRDDGLTHVDLADRRSGTKWVVARMVELVARHDPVAVVIDGVSAAASLVPELEAAGIEVTVTGASDHANACGALYDLVEEETVRHLGQPVLDAAVRAARKRPLGERWAWSRKGSVVDISPLVAVTLAAWGVATVGEDSEVMVAWA